MKMMPTTAATIFLVLPFYLTTFLLLPRSSLSFSHHRQCRQQKHQPQRLQLQHPSTSSTAASRLFSLHSSSSQRLHRLYAVTTGATESEKAGGRRSFFVQSFVRTMKKVAISSTVSSIVVGGVGGGMINVANAALPSVTVTEFETILKDSCKLVFIIQYPFQTLFYMVKYSSLTLSNHTQLLYDGCNHLLFLHNDIIFRLDFYLKTNALFS